MAEKKKGGIKTIIIFFIIGLVVAVALLFVGYISFEFNRLSYMNLNLKSDWRSYLAYLTKDIPYVNKMVKYEYLKVGDPILLQTKLIEEKQKAIEDEKKKLEAQKKEMQKLLEKITKDSSDLILKKEEVQKLSSEYEKKINDYNNYNNRVKKIAEWLSSSTPSKIIKALQQSQVKIDLIVDALYILQPSIVGELLDAMSEVNPDKAAQIISKLGEKGSGSSGN
ncbi:hypothetical protein OSSY52_22850 [Tepiditoga spiralis]|uniref:Magnesium transporter MgtE intracellular domain-containing protein n=1 Tax=Tepiditoga spiralis TaxID=2108365 RepID=A0A7G1GA36_9BACT|nr:hypothetical protein [Tepiditoga spiralis]BBE32144.1 hypothetical protein OSSY52_22850 [Tepiditoga spiralis]